MAGPQPTRCQDQVESSNHAFPREVAILDRRALRRRPGSPETVPAVRVLLAESAGLIRAGLRSLLEREDDILVESMAASGEEAVALASDLRPDVVLMGMRVGGIGALPATRRIVSDPELREVRVVILTADECEEDLYGALGSGASGYLPLDTEPVELVRAVRVVAAGGAQLSPWAARRVLEAFASTHEPQPPQPGAFEELTMRERHVVSLAARGLTNSEIAEQLVVSPATVKTHVSRAMLKLHARDRAKLVALAYQTGFVELRRALEASGPPDDSSRR